MPSWREIKRKRREQSQRLRAQGIAPPPPEAPLMAGPTKAAKDRAYARRPVPPPQTAPEPPQEAKPAPGDE